MTTRVLFVTYAVIRSIDGGPVMIGVLKRCLRLVRHLPASAIEPHLLHFGPVPGDDPLVREVLALAPCHDLGWMPTRTDFRALINRLAPQMLVLGEGPARGMMLAASKTAHEGGIPQIAIDNYYCRRQLARFVHDSPWVDRWFLLGLPDGQTFGRLSARGILAPPLLEAAPAYPPPPVDVAILGYDSAVAGAGERLVARLPYGSSVLLLRSRLTHMSPDLQRDGRPLAVCAPPNDAKLRALLGGARIVVAKSGFQQMIEALAIGTPVLALAAPGAVPEAWLAPHLRRFVRYLPQQTGGDWSPALAAAAGWLAERPRMPWTGTVAALARPVAYAAGLLQGLIEETEDLRRFNSTFAPSRAVTTMR